MGDPQSVSLHFGVRVRYGGAAVVRAQIKKRANPNYVAEDDMASLHWAARHGDTEIACILLEAGAKPDARDRWGHTPLHWAAINGHNETVGALLERKVKPYVVDKAGKTPMHYAAEGGHDKVVKLLVGAVPENYEKHIIEIAAKLTDSEKREKFESAVKEALTLHPAMQSKMTKALENMGLVHGRTGPQGVIAEFLSTADIKNIARVNRATRDAFLKKMREGDPKKAAPDIAIEGGGGGGGGDARSAPARLSDNTATTEAVREMSSGQKAKITSTRGV